MNEPQAYANTDREIWRKGDGDGNGMSYYEPSIHVTDRGNIGINVGGLVFEKSIEEWHRLARIDPGDPPSIPGSSSPMTPRAGDATQVAKDGQLGSPSDSQPGSWWDDPAKWLLVIPLGLVVVLILHFTGVAFQ